jgi:hypothetical protein
MSGQVGHPSGRLPRDKHRRRPGSDHARRARAGGRVSQPGSHKAADQHGRRSHRDGASYVRDHTGECRADDHVGDARRGQGHMGVSKRYVGPSRIVSRFRNASSKISIVRQLSNKRLYRRAAISIDELRVAESGYLPHFFVK